MGVVYKAQDTILRRTVALKFFKPELLENEESRSRLVREARAASTLDHPNICTIHHVEEGDEEGLFICMGYCEGETLRDVISSSRFGVTDKLLTTIQIAEGLAHAHDNGIVHRDIKPENVVVSPDGRARIMDFGLAKLTGQTTVLKSGTVAGTLPYMSPEQIRGSGLDHRTDIWSLGTILYELLTGRPPFTGEYEASVLYSIANEPVTPPTKVSRDVSSDLEKVVLKALEKSPGDRYQSMKEMIKDLKTIHSGLVGDTKSKVALNRRRSTAGLTRRRTMYAALVSIFVLTSAVFIGTQTKTETAPVSVAVLDFENSAGEKDFDTILPILLTTDLMQTPNVRVLGKERMRELQDEMGIEKVDESNGFELAKRAGVQMLISGEVVRMGKTLRVAAGVYDVETKELLFARQEEGEGRDAVLDMIDGLSESIRKGMNVLPRWGLGSEPSLSALTSKSVDAYRLYEMGEEIRDDDPEEAVEYMKQAVEQDTTFAKAFMELALLYNHQLEDPDNALRCARKAKELLREATPKEYLKALIYESWVLGEWDSVIEFMNRYLELQPNDPRVQRRLGWVLAHGRRSKYDEAIRHFERMIELDPKNISGEISSAYNHLGNLRMYMGDYEGAMAAFEGYRRLCPNAPAPLHSIGNACRLSGRYEEAVEQFSRIIERDPKYYISHESLGMTYLAMGRWRAALSVFLRYLAAAPSEGHVANAHVRIATVYCVQRNYGLALDEIEEALAIDSTSVDAMWRRGLIKLESQGCGGVPSEIDCIERILKESGSGTDRACLHHLSGRLRLAQGQSEEALEELKQAVDSSERDEFYFFRRELVRGYVEAGSAEEALREGAALLRYNPNDGELLYLLGSASEMMGDLESMRSYCSRAVKTWEQADRDFAPLKAARTRL